MECEHAAVARDSLEQPVLVGGAHVSELTVLESGNGAVADDVARLQQLELFTGTCRDVRDVLLAILVRYIAKLCVDDMECRGLRSTLRDGGIPVARGERVPQLALCPARCGNGDDDQQVQLKEVACHSATTRSARTGSRGPRRS